MNKATIKKELSTVENRIETCEKSIRFEQAKVAAAEQFGYTLFYDPREKMTAWRNEISELSVKKAILEGKLKGCD